MTDMSGKEEPLNLMPLDEFKRFVQAIARVRKAENSEAEPPKPVRRSKKPLH